MYIVRTKIRRLAKESGKIVSKTYYEYLDRRVREIVAGHIVMLGRKKTLRVKAIKIIDASRMTMS